MEAVLPCLVADLDRAEQVNVVRPVQERFGRGRPVGTDLADELAGDAAVNPAGILTHARPARGAEASPVVGDGAVPGSQQGRFLVLP